MPDITMCKGDGCDLRVNCHRYRATPTPHWQAYFVTPPISNGDCDHFWEDEKMTQTKLSAICPPDPTGFFSRAPFAAESETSEAAAEHMMDTGKHWKLKNYVYFALRCHTGLTDEQITASITAGQPAPRHTSVVSARNSLVRRGLVRDSGRKRKSETSGRMCAVWEVVR